MDTTYQRSELNALHHNSIRIRCVEIERIQSCIIAAVVVEIAWFYALNAENCLSIGLDGFAEKKHIDMRDL